MKYSLECYFSYNLDIKRITKFNISTKDLNSYSDISINGRDI